MASVATLPAHTRVEHRELSDSMDRVREELEKVRSAPDADNVHDLRVAIRRCRSVATVFEEIDPDPAWPEMRKTAKKLFRALGELRDAHVMAERIKELGPASDPVRVHLLGLLEAAEPKLRDEVVRVAGKFDEKAWEHLQRRLRRRVRFIPVGGLAAECLAWERFEEIKQLHAHALRSSKAKPWHALRIGLKKLRYTVEALLPVHYAAWSENLKRLQDLLGDIHDFDVLEDKVKGEEELPGAARKSWKDNLEQERGKRVQTYRQLTLGKPASGISGGTLCRMERGWRRLRLRGCRRRRARRSLVHGRRRAWRGFRCACLICCAGRARHRCLARRICGANCARRRCCMGLDRARSIREKRRGNFCWGWRFLRGGRGRIGSWWRGWCVFIAGRSLPLRTASLRR